jgi:hypothetical protein
MYKVPKLLLLLLLLHTLLRQHVGTKIFTKLRGLGFYKVEGFKRVVPKPTISSYTDQASPTDVSVMTTLLSRY